jgi:hypothetical protein
MAKMDAIKAPVIRLRKEPNATGGVSLLFWLPSSKEFGNLLPKLIWIQMRVDEINRLTSAAFTEWGHARAGRLGDHAQYHIFAIEHAVFQMRRVADELVGLHSVLRHYEAAGSLPQVVSPDHVGGVLANNDVFGEAPFQGHEDFLRTLNDIHNAHKHSFINSDSTVGGRDEPTVNALSRHRNRDDSPVQFHSVSLRQLCMHFEGFCIGVLEWLQDCSQRLPDNPARNQA